MVACDTDGFTLSHTSSSTTLEGSYNPRRRHSALGFQSPERYEQKESVEREKIREAVAV